MKITLFLANIFFSFDIVENNVCMLSWFRVHPIRWRCAIFFLNISQIGRFPLLILTLHFLCCFFACDAFHVHRCVFIIVLSTRSRAVHLIADEVIQYSKHSQCDFQSDSDECNMNYLLIHTIVIEGSCFVFKPDRS